MICGRVQVNNIGYLCFDGVFVQVLSSIPTSHRNVFKYICAFLRKLLQHSATNKLDAKSLGINGFTHVHLAALSLLEFGTPYIYVRHGMGVLF